ncbi:DUF2000 family protein [Microbacterium sp. NPDC090003]|uniref:DUF2000 family protein n=1 Tax=Microbacterium sp. NPDC090003 TaxID=3364203 RepID=UPI0037F28D37
MTSAPPTSTPLDQTARFDTKVVVLLGESLAAWQELNVTAFLMSGITVSAPDLTGGPYRDRDGTTYLPMLRQPVLVMTGNSDLLRSVRDRASDRGDVALAIYTRELFATAHDDANRAAVAAVGTTDLDLVGLALRGPRNAVDRMLKGARMHS